eukprot:TRINITY_DN607_c1_g1_i1.p1 TRINITY_DN607_c1_g1~~TRINITY_DN607_c1_g1_i1.p1  ORF type:complete len:4186 (+),score=1120.96 TRINITY_DN607_c1_g1_i1:108-12560(+)
MVRTRVAGIAGNLQRAAHNQAVPKISPPPRAESQCSRDGEAPDRSDGAEQASEGALLHVRDERGYGLVRYGLMELRRWHRHCALCPRTWFRSLRVGLVIHLRPPGIPERCWFIGTVDTLSDHCVTIVWEDDQNGGPPNDWGDLAWPRRRPDEIECSDVRVSKRSGALGFAVRGTGVCGVLPGSSADVAGLRAGATIVAVDGTPVEGESDLLRLLRSPSDAVQLRVCYDWWCVTDAWWDLQGSARSGNPLRVDDYNTIASSCGIHRKHWVRILCIKIVDHVWFDRFVLVLIIVNASLLALGDPRLDSQSGFQAFLTVAEWIFIALFTVEAALKILARGFVMHSGAYLRYPWNVLDLFLVIVGVLQFMLPSSSITVVRMLRVLRPLRTVSRVWRMQVLLETLIQALPAMGNIILVLVFTLWLFAILGVQLFSGSMHYSCFVPAGAEVPAPFLNGTAAAAGAQPAVCEHGGLAGWVDSAGKLTKDWRSCNDMRTCGTAGSAHTCNAMFGQVCKHDQHDTNAAGSFTFDDIFQAGLLCMKVFSLDDWPVDQENIQNRYGHHVWIFFFLMCVLGNYFVFNLVLAVLACTFNQVVARRLDEDIMEKVLQMGPADVLGAVMAQPMLAVCCCFVLGRPPGDEDAFDVVAQLVPLYIAADGGPSVGQSAFEAITRDQSPQGSPTAEPISMKLSAAQRADATAEKRKAGMSDALGYRIRNKAVASGQLTSSAMHGGILSRVAVKRPGQGADADSDSAPPSPRSPRSPRSLQSPGASGRRKTLRSPSQLRRLTLAPDSPGAPSGRMLPRAAVQSSRGSGGSNAGADPEWRIELQGVMEGITVMCFVGIVSLFNIIVLTLERYPEDQGVTNFIDKADLACSCVFLVEAITKLTAYGLRYFKDRYNIVDFILVILSIPGMMEGLNIAEFGPENRGGNALRALRILRITRILRVARFRRLHSVTATVVRSIRSVFWLSSLMALFVFVYGVLGMHLFQGQLSLADQELRLNFSTFGDSVLTVFVVLTGEGWASLMKATIRQYGAASCLFYLSAYFIGNCVLLNLFVAILVEEFAIASLVDEEYVIALPEDIVSCPWFRKPDENAMVPPTELAPAVNGLYLKGSADPEHPEWFKVSGGIQDGLYLPIECVRELQAGDGDMDDDDMKQLHTGYSMTPSTLRAPSDAAAQRLAAIRAAARTVAAAGEKTPPRSAGGSPTLLATEPPKPGTAVRLVRPYTCDGRVFIAKGDVVTVQRVRAGGARGYLAMVTLEPRRSALSFSDKRVGEVWTILPFSGAQTGMHVLRMTAYSDRPYRARVAARQDDKVLLVWNRPSDGGPPTTASEAAHSEWLSREQWDTLRDLPLGHAELAGSPAAGRRSPVGGSSWSPQSRVQEVLQSPTFAGAEGPVSLQRRKRLAHAGDWVESCGERCAHGSFEVDAAHWSCCGVRQHAAPCPNKVAPDTVPHGGNVFEAGSEAAATPERSTGPSGREDTGTTNGRRASSATAVYIPEEVEVTSLDDTDGVSASSDRPLPRRLKWLKEDPPFAAFRARICRYVLGKQRARESVLHGRSLGCVEATQELRVKVHAVVRHPIFERFVIFLIAANAVLVSLDTPDVIDHSPRLSQGLRRADIVFAALFLLECLMKIFVYGLACESRHAYLRDAWNAVDLFVAAVSVAAVFSESLRPFRALRTIRLIVRIPSTRAMVEWMLEVIPVTADTILMILTFMFVWAILGLHLFKGYLWRCSDVVLTGTTGNATNMQDCKGNFTHSVMSALGPVRLEATRTWGMLQNSYDNIGHAMMSLFEVAIGDGWVALMFDVVDAPGEGEGPREGAAPERVLYFLIFIVIAQFVMMNLFVGVIIDTFLFVKQKRKGQGVLGPRQIEWLALQQVLISGRPGPRMVPPANPVREWCWRLATGIREGRHAQIEPRVGAFAAVPNCAGSLSLSGLALPFEDMQPTDLRFAEAPLKSSGAAPWQERCAGGWVDTPERLVNLPQHITRGTLFKTEKGHPSGTRLRVHGSRGTQVYVLCEGAIPGWSADEGAVCDHSFVAGLQASGWTEELCSLRCVDSAGRSSVPWRMFRWNIKDILGAETSVDLPPTEIDGYRYCVVVSSGKQEARAPFDVLICSIIVLNSVIMSLSHHNMDPDLEYFLEISNIVFVWLYVAEFIIKVVGLGPVLYYADVWNRFDFAVLCVSLFGLFAQAGSALSVVRLFRVGRLIRLVRAAKGLKRLFGTLIDCIPSLLQVTVLLVVVFFMFAAIGVDLFGRVHEQPQGYEQDHPAVLLRFLNFRNAYYALVTLLAVSTTEDWSVLMYAVQEQSPGCEQNNSCGVSAPVATIFFISFIVVGALLIVNLFVTVVVDSYQIVIQLETEQTGQKWLHELADFHMSWQELDPKGGGSIDAADVQPLLELLRKPLGINTAALWAQHQSCGLLGTTPFLEWIRQLAGTQRPPEGSYPPLNGWGLAVPVLLGQPSAVRVSFPQGSELGSVGVVINDISTLSEQMQSGRQLGSRGLAARSAGLIVAVEGAPPDCSASDCWALALCTAAAAAAAAHAAAKRRTLYVWGLPSPETDESELELAGRLQRRCERFGAVEQVWLLPRLCALGGRVSAFVRFSSGDGAVAAAAGIRQWLSEIGGRAAGVKLGGSSGGRLLTVRRVLPGSRAAESGVRQGMLLAQVGGQRVANLQQALAAWRRAAAAGDFDVVFAYPAGHLFKHVRHKDLVSAMALRFCGISLSEGLHASAEQRAVYPLRTGMYSIAHYAAVQKLALWNSRQRALRRPAELGDVIGRYRSMLTDRGAEKFGDLFRGCTMRLLLREQRRSRRSDAIFAALRRRCSVVGGCVPVDELRECLPPEALELLEGSVCRAWTLTDWLEALGELRARGEGDAALDAVEEALGVPARLLDGSDWVRVRAGPGTEWYTGVVCGAVAEVTIWSEDGQLQSLVEDPAQLAALRRGFAAVLAALSSAPCTGDEAAVFCVSASAQDARHGTLLLQSCNTEALRAALAAFREESTVTLPPFGTLRVKSAPLQPLVRAVSGEGSAVPCPVELPGSAVAEGMMLVARPAQCPVPCCGCAVYAPQESDDVRVLWAPPADGGPPAEVSGEPFPRVTLESRSWLGDSGCVALLPARTWEHCEFGVQASRRCDLRLPKGRTAIVDFCSVVQSKLALAPHQLELTAVSGRLLQIRICDCENAEAKARDLEELLQHADAADPALAGATVLRWEGGPVGAQAGAPRGRDSGRLSPVRGPLRATVKLACEFCDFNPRLFCEDVAADVTVRGIPLAVNQVIILSLQRGSVIVDLHFESTEGYQTLWAFRRACAGDDGVQSRIQRWHPVSCRCSMGEEEGPAAGRSSTQPQPQQAPRAGAAASAAAPPILLPMPQPGAGQGEPLLTPATPQRDGQPLAAGSDGALSVADLSVGARVLARSAGGGERRGTITSRRSRSGGAAGEVAFDVALDGGTVLLGVGQQHLRLAADAGPSQSFRMPPAPPCSEPEVTEEPPPVAPQSGAERIVLGQAAHRDPEPRQECAASLGNASPVAPPSTAPAARYMPVAPGMAAKMYAGAAAKPAPAPAAADDSQPTTGRTPSPQQPAFNPLASLPGRSSAQHAARSPEGGGGTAAARSPTVAWPAPAVDLITLLQGAWWTQGGDVAVVESMSVRFEQGQGTSDLSVVDGCVTLCGERLRWLRGKVALWSDGDVWHKAAAARAEVPERAVILDVSPRAGEVQLGMSPKSGRVGSSAGASPTAAAAATRSRTVERPKPYSPGEPFAPAPAAQRSRSEPRQAGAARLPAPAAAREPFGSPSGDAVNAPFGQPEAWTPRSPSCVSPASTAPAAADHALPLSPPKRVPGRSGGDTLQVSRSSPRGSSCSADGRRLAAAQFPSVAQRSAPYGTPEPCEDHLDPCGTEQPAGTAAATRRELQFSPAGSVSAWSHGSPTRSILQGGEGASAMAQPRRAARAVGRSARPRRDAAGRPVVRLTVDLLDVYRKAALEGLAAPFDPLSPSRSQRLRSTSAGSEHSPRREPPQPTPPPGGRRGPGSSPGAAACKPLPRPSGALGSPSPPRRPRPAAPRARGAPRRGAAAGGGRSSPGQGSPGRGRGARRPPGESPPRRSASAHGAPLRRQSSPPRPGGGTSPRRPPPPADPAPKGAKSPRRSSPGRGTPAAERRAEAPPRFD